MAETPPGFLIAAPSSGCGKTTVTLALLSALRQRGLRPAPFKVGPDFIDPGHHAAACARLSRNLDGWMCGQAQVRETFRRGCAGADVAVIEGVMGLFDGAAGESDAGSSAEIARWLGARVILVVDAARQARSVAALVQGFVRFSAELEFGGILLNRVGSARHEQLLRRALASVPDLPPVLGALPRAAEVSLPERHLGLVTAADVQRRPEHFDHLGRWFEEHADLDLVLSGLARTEESVSGEESAAPAPGGQNLSVPIAVARDEAFCFYYPENLEFLEAAGARLKFFSPLHDRALPADIAGIYLGGGYPELHAARLAANAGLLAEIRRRAEEGLPVYAECGGLMMLSDGIDGHSMAGVIPGAARMLARRKALGYREIKLTRNTLLGPAGMRLRGHEFHYSELEVAPRVARAYRMARAGGEELGMEGYQCGNVLGSYVHLHFASNPVAARNFVEFCRRHVS